jgi:hypothetical protein
MKLSYWRIAGLPSYDNFAVESVITRPGVLQLNLQHIAEESLRVVITFYNHIGHMVCDEFGMDRYIVGPPAEERSGGSNFYTASESDFKAFLTRGSADAIEGMEFESYIIVDSDHWIEIITKMPPDVKILAPDPGRSQH